MECSTCGPLERSARQTDEVDWTEGAAPYGPLAPGPGPGVPAESAHLAGGVGWGGVIEGWNGGGGRGGARRAGLVSTFPFFKIEFGSTSCSTSGSTSSSTSRRPSLCSGLGAG